MRPNGTAIRTIRKAQNLSLRGLARQARCHPSHLSRLERGQAGASDDTIQRLADGLAVPVGAIATLTEETQ